jgi:hypothetical protein
MRIARWVAALLLCATAIPLMAAEQDPAQKKAAEEWLALVDAGKYGDSWEHASDTFKKSISKENWEAAVKRVRGQLGKLESRAFTKSQATSNPPNAPPGDYSVVVYTANFETKKSAIEVVVLENEKNVWHVGGYFIK